MFNTLTQQAREVMRLAGEESCALGHEYIGTEHILLALLLEPAYGGSGALARLGLNAAAVRERVANLVQRGPGPEDPDSPATRPLTPRAARAIRTASDEAANVGL